jgi:hypothetical protein
MLFSQRYFRAIENNVLVVDIPDAARRKLWAWLSANNASLGIQRNPNDSWISSSSVLEETERELLIEHGWDHLPVSPHSTKTEYHAALHLLVLDGPGPFIFDTIEIAANNMDAGERDSLRQKVNQIFELHDCPWRIAPMFDHGKADWEGEIVFKKPFELSKNLELLVGVGPHGQYPATPLGRSRSLISCIGKHRGSAGS